GCGCFGVFHGWFVEAGVVVAGGVGVDGGGSGGVGGGAALVEGGLGEGDGGEAVEVGALVEGGGTGEDGGVLVTGAFRFSGAWVLVVLACVAFFFFGL